MNASTDNANFHGQFHAQPRSGRQATRMSLLYWLVNIVVMITPSSVD